MKKFAVILIAISALLSGCVVYDTPYRDHSQYRGDRDRDGDGVPNRQDRRPDDPRRY